MTRIVCAAALPILMLAACSGEPETDPELADAAEAQMAPATPVPQMRSPVEPEPMPAGDDMTLTLKGLGGIAFGRPAPESGEFALDADDVQISDQCRTYRSKRYPDIYAMGDGRKIMRITLIDGTNVRTRAGIGPGASEDEVRAAYPDIQTSPHAYIGAPGKYLDWKGKNGQSGMRFEIGLDGTVQVIHAGLPPFLTYIEGCA